MAAIADMRYVMMMHHVTLSNVSCTEHEVIVQNTNARRDRQNAIIGDRNEIVVFALLTYMVLNCYSSAIIISEAPIWGFKAPPESERCSGC